ncbi:MAG: hypothetical protein AAGD18_17710 [Actinomycetota bacterium]
MSGDLDGWIVDGLAAAAAELPGGLADDVEQIHGSGGGTFSSTVLRARSGDRPVVVKLVRRNDVPADHLFSWRRELDAHRTGWLADRLPEGLALAPCLATTTTDEAAVLVLDRIDFDDVGARTEDWYHEFARRLARLSATPVDDPPDWASHHFIEEELRLTVEAAPGLMRSPAVAIAEMVSIWSPAYEALLAAPDLPLRRLAAVPVGFQHLDAFSRNAADLGGPIALIDWAYAGFAPLGADAAAMVVINALYGDAEPARVPELRHAVVDGYLAGVRDSGVTLDADVLAEAIDTLCVLRWLRFLTQVNEAGPEISGVASSIAGHAFEHLVREWEALTALFLPRSEELLSERRGGG